eukprot:8124057-Heterocapsa_arctica.AAC.1
MFYTSVRLTGGRGHRWLGGRSCPFPPVLAPVQAGPLRLQGPDLRGLGGWARKRSAGGVGSRPAVGRLGLIGMFFHDKSTGRLRLQGITSSYLA